jgi:hypothetical protein
MEGEEYTTVPISQNVVDSNLISPRSPTREDVDAKMCALNEAVRQLETTQDSNVKDRAVRALNEAYNWLATHGIDFYYDVGTERFRV